ncbi:MAG TPA: sigma-70 family RNA polymerase sigma factor [Thermomicrobiales bacterium]
MLNWDAATDEDVLRGIARYDESALGALYDRYSRPAHRLALRVLGERGAAEEVVQEAFLSIWRRAGSFEPGRGSAERWILSITHHRAIDRLRASLHSRRDEVPIELFDAVLLDHVQQDDVESVVWRDELERWLADLPESQRRILELAYFDGYKQHEIAAMMDVPLGTVKSRLRTALQMIRALPAVLLARSSQAPPTVQTEIDESALERL